MILNKMAIGVFALCLIAVSVDAGLFSGSGGIACSHGDECDRTNGGASFDWCIPATFKEKTYRFTFTGSGFSDLRENIKFATSDCDYLKGCTYDRIGTNGVSSAIKKLLKGSFTENAIFNYNFAITNTTCKTGNPGKYGSVFTVASRMSSEFKSDPGRHHSFGMFGFASDRGTTIRTDFCNPVGSNHSAQHFTSIVKTEPANVPEPGILSLFILGFSSLGSFALLRRKN